jgi:hypothetical protein
MRARGLSRRREHGEELAALDRRRLDAHLAGCERCRDFSDRLEPVGGGKEPASAATLSPVEAAGTTEERTGSDVDAMGQDKHRQVVGQGGPDRKRQFIYYGTAVVIVVLLYFGAKIAVDELDKAPKQRVDQAPWSKPQSPQTQPQSFQ